MTFIRRHAVLHGGTVIFATSLLLAACGGKGDDKQAYEACLAVGKDKYSSAKFESQDKSTITKVSDTSVTVRIPYMQEGAGGTLECMLTKQPDGKFAVSTAPADTAPTTTPMTPPTTPPATEAVPATPPATDTTPPPTPVTPPAGTAPAN